MKTRDEILKAETAKEVLLWIQSAPDELVDEEVCQYFNFLAAKELREYIGPDYDPEMHYDIPRRKKEANDD
ncbi:hypothetical protein AALA82_18655 [Oscillospiraceae bacterium 50-16]